MGRAGFTQVRGLPMALVAEPLDAIDVDVIDARIVDAKIINGKIVGGKIVGGRIIDGSVNDAKQFELSATRARYVDTEAHHSVIVAVLGLGLAILLMQIL